MVINWLRANWLALLALLISTVSMGVATFNTYLNWREKRRKLRVRLKFVYPRLGEAFLSIRVKNKGCSIELTDLQFIVAKAGRYQVSHPPAVDLKPRESHEYKENPGRLADGIVKCGVNGVAHLSASIHEKGGKEWVTNHVICNLACWSERYRRRLETH